MIPKDAEKAIAEHFEVPHNVRRMAERATFDLYYGPIGFEHDEEGDEPWPGFSEAIAVVGDWCDLTLDDVWYDSQTGQVLDRGPEGYDEECYECGGTGNDPVEGDEDGVSEEHYGDCPWCAGRGERWIEPTWEDFYHFELGDVKRALFDKELVAYI